MIPEEALLMAGAHLAVLPIGAGTKWPPFKEWQHRATDDVEMFDEWWPNGSNAGVGWKMGVQPDGRWLFAIDVDVNKGGKSSLQDLIREFGLRDEFAGTVTARTGGGGFHFVFELPPDPAVVPTNLSKLRDGLDIRAENGQIVVAPSRHMETGVAYAWVDGKAPWQISPSVASPKVMTMMAALLKPSPPLASVTPINAVERSRDRHPSAGLSPADWVRLRWDFSTFLVKYAWSHLGGESWRRPGKTDRGSSAELKNSGEGPLNIFTTEIPVEVARLGKLDRSGQCVSITLFDLIAAYEFGGDRQACARWVAQDPQFVAERAPLRVSSPESAVEPVVPSAALNLPAGFWGQRPFLGQVFETARASMASPDALLVATLARISALIPPAYKLPAVIGSLMGLDFMGCVVAETSGGKGLATGVARRLVPAPDDDLDRAAVMMDVPVGSGEGLVQAFMVPEVDVETGKPTGRQRVGKQGLHFTIDEGMALIAQGGREGATILATMCSAWSGEALGQLNARKETRRVIPPGKVRVAAVMNMQVSNAWRLFEPTVAALGFTGRVVFASAHDPSSAADFDREFTAPGPLDLPEWPGYSLGVVELSYDAAIRREIRASRQGVLDLSSSIDMLRSQYLLARCKLAAILAMIEDRRDVSQDDWALGGDILNMSSAMLDHLLEVRRTAIRDQRHSQGETRGEIESVAEDVKARRAVARVAALVLSKLNEPQTLGALRRGLAGRDRDHLRAALDRLGSDGLIVELDDVVRKA